MSRNSLIFFALAVGFGGAAACSSSSAGPSADAGGGGNDATTGDAGGGSDTGTGSDTGGGDSGSGDDGSTQQDSGTSTACHFADGGAFFPKIDTVVCKPTDTCALFIHQIDCCGSKHAYGVLQQDLAAFQAAETQWEAECAACNCAAKPTTTDDGKSGPDNTIQVSCVNDPQYPPASCQSLIP